jgi:hypothetical protein
VRTIVRIAVMAIAACTVASARGLVAPLDTQADLNTFMKEVLERRDENWKKLQQYILDENEKIEVFGLGRHAHVGPASRISVVHSRRAIS